MKKVLLFIITVIFSININAQDSQLFDNVWYIEDIVISGVSTTPPNSVNENISRSLEFTDFNSFINFGSTICDSLGGVLTFDDTLSNFSFTELNATLGGGCSFIENINFESIYFSFYFDNQGTPFTYSIIQNVNSKTLIVTAANGDQVIYGSAVLSVQEYEDFEVKLYPNPTVSKVYINNKRQESNLKLHIYDLNGKLIKSKKIDTVAITIVDIEDFKPGAYFFIFETKKGNVEIKRIIKTKN
ncbi:T9SS type A sorting domain-containing protein [uncultured Lacinutrix sp.]|uniref:T9SS type A sorting domain-containing protein n=1 Tax=uncultured Lacinutrix sp. TaxID=574032 RepID=UPI00260EF41D|nr:T9SS type A sorting domain-containing protein [uncultured Lacinutrix sp.]